MKPFSAPPGGSSFTEMPSAPHRDSISPTSGSPPPHSHFETVLSLMESFSASCRWVRPSSLRRAAMNRPVFA